jgi:sugar lactone lactonase YvrE
LPDQFCVENRTTAQVSVSYEAIPSSNKLWTSNLLGFPSSMLAASGDADPIVVEASAGKDVAFDVDGNLWALGATVADPLIVRFPAAELGSSGVKEWDLAINVPDIACLPAVKAFTLDRSGQLWLVACGEQVMRIDSFDLGESGDVTPGIVISELPASEDVAVDADGNLWIATGSSLLRYDANHLLESSSDPADLTLTVRDAEDSRDLDPSGIAFDADGNLWGFGFGSNTVFRAAAADLEGDGEATVVSAVSISIGVDVLVARGAFDDGGGLWLSYSGGRLARLGPEQLGTSIGTGDSVVPERLVASDALGSDLRLAFFAGAAGLPLLASSYD